MRIFLCFYANYICIITFNNHKMKTIKNLFFVTITLIIASCSSNEDQPATSLTPTTTSGFTWRENDPNSTTIKTAFGPTFSTQYKTLIAKDQAGATLFEVNLSGETVGTYTIDNSTNVVTYTGENPYFIASSGTVNITTSANGKVSGNFEAFRSNPSGTAGFVSRIYANFIDITIVP